jgi:MFS family permease
VFLGQYFQVARGHSPAAAGLLTMPLMIGVLASSVVSGRLITRTGRYQRYVVAGLVLLSAGFALLGTIDHRTSLWLVGAYLVAVGAGVGMSMQNLVLAVQNTVDVDQVGAAGATVAFFRSMGGTVGVSVLGAVLAARVQTLVADGLRGIGVSAPPSGDSTGLDLAALPEPVREVVRAAYGDATSVIFLAAAGVALLGLVAVALLREVPLRTTVRRVTGAEAVEREPATIA